MARIIIYRSKATIITAATTILYISPGERPAKNVRVNRDNRSSEEEAASRHAVSNPLGQLARALCS